VSLGSCCTSWLCHISEFSLEPMDSVTLGTSEKEMHAGIVCVVSLDEQWSRRISYLTYSVLNTIEGFV